MRDIIKTDATLSESLLPLLDARLVLYHCFRELDNCNCKQAHVDPVCQRLMSAPGVGFVTALTYTCSGWIPPVPTAKRSATHAKTRPTACHKRWELDIKARLERRRS